MLGEHQQARSPDVPADSPGDRLAVLSRLAAEAGASEIAADATALAERLAEGQFYVACVGQFKRGKSTLLNALIGQSLLPAGVVPITTAVTVLRYGERVRARVRLRMEWRDVTPSEIAAYVSDEQNPANEKGVSVVEVFVPNTLLASGMCLVDTPGIGSVITANTDATRAFVPHVDAALVVIGADPPISGDEVALIEQLAQHVHELIFVLGKADRLADSERRDAVAFARRVLAQRLGRRVGPIFEVSAMERLGRGVRSRDWPSLEAALTTLAATTGAALVREAEHRGRVLLVDRLLHDIAEQRGALMRPVDESEQRSLLLRECVAAGERALNDLGPLFSAEQQRLSARFKEQWEQFIVQAVPAARANLAMALRQVTGDRGAARGQAIQLAQEIAARWGTHWLNEAPPAAEQLYRTAVQRFVEVANGFLDRLAASAGALAGLPRSVSPEAGFRTASRFYSTGLMHLTGRSPLRWFADMVQPARTVRQRMEREVSGYVERLLATNSARILNDLDDRMLESRRHLEGEIRGSLRAVCVSAERALQRARSQQAAGTQAVRAEVERLDAIRQHIEELRG